MILLNLSIENFKSFKKRQVLDFTVNNNAPSLYGYREIGKSKKRSMTAVSVWGDVGFGKSNFIEAVSFLKKVIVSKNRYIGDKFYDYDCFVTDKKKPSVFEVEFYLKGSFYNYFLKVDSEKILEEVLKTKKEGGRSRYSLLVERRYNKKELRYDLNGSGLNLNKRLMGLASFKRSVVSIGKILGNKDLSKIYNAFTNIQISKKNDSGYISISSDSMLYSKRKDIFSKIKKFLVNVEPTLIDIRVEEGNRVSVYKPYGIYKIGNKKVERSFNDIGSSGIKHLYNILGKIFLSLESGSPCFIDDMDLHLSLGVLRHLPKMFSGEFCNIKNVQLFSTVHNPTFMNFFDEYEIFIVDKNGKGESEIYSLRDIEGIRLDDSYFKKYLSGRYGGVLDIDYEHADERYNKR